MSMISVAVTGLQKQPDNELPVPVHATYAIRNDIRILIRKMQEQHWQAIYSIEEIIKKEETL